MDSSFTKYPPLVALCDNVMEFEFTTGLTEGTENIHVILSPAYTGSGSLGLDVIHPQAEGGVRVDLHEYLRYGFYAGRLSRRLFTYPDATPAGFAEWAQLCKSYKITAMEGFGFDPPIYTNYLLEDRYVMRGKIPKWLHYRFYNDYTSFWSWLVTKKAFLTFAPSTIPTTVAQTQKLYFMVYYAPIAGAKLKLKVTCAFTDGTNGNFTTALETPPITQYSVFEFHCGYTSLGLAAWIAANHAGKTLYSYKVEAIDDATIVSEAKEYIVEYNGSLSERQFIFANNAGGYDTLMTKGIGELTSSFEYEIIDVKAISHLDIDRDIFNITESEAIKVSTGWLTEEQLEYLPEMLQSKECYEITDKGLRLVIWNNQSIVRKRDQSQLFAAELSYGYADYQRVEQG